MGLLNWLRRKKKPENALNAERNKTSGEKTETKRKRRVKSTVKDA